ncbi:unnamed protein product [Adineta steineri]|uniref:Uncharacterized protein n=1 Tax=Adineta steineri TaxID=433720 RepID=A0A815EYC0_9BILA|nr:unnamed protein product [Adineta steineri]CAF3707780.1 unnamed protein product [Adineta steineri]
MDGPADINGKSHPETDNFLPCKFVIGGITYSSAENYFQCAKTTNDTDRNMVQIMSHGEEDAHHAAKIPNAMDKFAQSSE